jgi:hypothetical protein
LPEEDEEEKVGDSPTRYRLNTITAPLEEADQHPTEKEGEGEGPVEEA